MPKLMDLPTEILLHILKDDEIEPWNTFQATQQHCNSLLLCSKFEDNITTFCPCTVDIARKKRVIRRDWAQKQDSWSHFISHLSTKSTNRLNRFASLPSRLTALRTVTIHFEGDHKYHHFNANPRSAVPLPIADILDSIFQSLSSKGCEKLMLYNKSYHLQPENWEVDADPDESLNHNLIRTNNDEPERASPAPSINLTKGLMAKAKAGLRSVIRRSKGPPLLPPKNPDMMYRPFDPSLWVTTLFPGVEEVSLPLPYVPRFASPSEYWRRQTAILDKAAQLLLQALRVSRLDKDSSLP
ncbi:hypothetical protein BDZ97DRAFT_1915945 [Flammula alnicola]|nr:hypothetical protein BDZ97DRAFT_1915945 [Flammula alnicola]